MKLDDAALLYGLRPRRLTEHPIVDFSQIPVEGRPVGFFGGMGLELPAGSCPFTKNVMANSSSRTFLQEALPYEPDVQELMALIDRHAHVVPRFMISDDALSMIDGIRLPDLWLDVRDVRHLPVSADLPSITECVNNRLPICLYGEPGRLWMRMRFDAPDLFHKLDGYDRWLPGPIRQLMNAIWLTLRWS